MLETTGETLSASEKAEISNLTKGDALERIRILTIDDDPQITRLVKAVLSVFGFGKIHAEYSAEAALEILNTQTFHFIICDWQMKGMSGVDFVRRLRHDVRSSNRFVPIIMLTGKAARENVTEARDAGITEFLVKPFTVKDLRKKIIEIIQNPRPFVVAPNYIGPDRRRKTVILPDGMSDRRKNKPK
jgi:two-component system chemotaxis response regulator CheY